MANEISLQEVCRLLGKSNRTITRYIKAGKLNLEKIKTQKGIEYRFSQSGKGNRGRPLDTSNSFFITRKRI